MTDWVNYGIIIGVLTILSVGILLAGLESIDKKVSLYWILVFGAIGWTIAYFLRIPLIQLLQIQVITSLGGDPFDLENIATFAKDWRVIIWGPILAGPFEEGIRFLIYKFYRISDLNPKESPLIGGLGWAFAEFILLVFIPLWGAEIIGTFSAFLVCWERISALLFHISMSHLIFYACRDPRSQKPLLWLAIILHSLLDMLIVVFIIFLGDFAIQNPIAYYLLLETSFTILTIICLLGIKQKIASTWNKYPIRLEILQNIPDNQSPNPPSKEEIKAQIKIDDF